MDPSRAHRARLSAHRRPALIALLGLLTSFPLPTGATELNLCIDFHCRHTTRVQITADTLARLRDRLHAATDPASERIEIARAIGHLERIAARTTPIGNDKARNAAVGEPGQLDCIAESRNTLAMLQLLESQHLLRWHQPQTRVRRAPWWFNIHWAVRLREQASGEDWVIDSWFRDNGEPAIVQSLSDWLAGAPIAP